MNSSKRTAIALILVILCLNILYTNNTEGCKDIIAIGDATAGEYNLLLKVRDPSRPGLQVLCIIPQNYEYTYHHPQTGKSWDFTVKNKYIGVATVDDTFPNIIKPGMALSDAGIAYGDADTNSNWRNIKRYAWDDFDWIRYACEQADTEDEAVELMTIDIVDELHAPGVSENLFIVGPEKGVVIEADNYHYDIKEINNGVVVMSNYPKELWRTQLHNRLPIASSFDIEKEKTMRRGGTVHLNGRFGVRIVKIGDDYIIAKQVPFFKISNKIIQLMGKPVQIELGTRETVGDYSVHLIDIKGRKATISVEYKFKAWEDKIMEYIQPKYGEITVTDMINWSRLHTDDLNGLRPMCEYLYSYEGVMIYKIPKEKYDILSSGWFSANHACSSIYVPVHICDNDIYDPYETGEAAKLSLDLLEIYGHDSLSSRFKKVEEVFLFESDSIDQIAQDEIDANVDVSDFLTICDMGMQKQAYLTEQLWFEIADNDNQNIADFVESIWKHNYSYSLKQMGKVITDLKKTSKSSSIAEKIVDIYLNICETRTSAARAIGKDVSFVEKELTSGRNLLENGNYDMGFDQLIKAYELNDLLLKGQKVQALTSDRAEDAIDFPFDLDYILITFFAIVIFLILIKKKQDQLF